MEGLKTVFELEDIESKLEKEVKPYIVLNGSDAHIREDAPDEIKEKYKEYTSLWKRIKYAKAFGLG